MKRTYGEYLNSPHWKRTRAEARRRAKGRCRACSTRASLETHHKTYKHLGREHQNELVVLCADHHDACHQFIAMWQKGIKERGWKPRSTYSITMKFVARERAKIRRKKSGKANTATQPTAESRSGRKIAAREGKAGASTRGRAR